MQDLTRTESICRDENAAIALDQFYWGHPNELQTQWLTAQGVSLNSLLCPWPIGATTLRFDGDRFEPDRKGINALTLVCFDRGEPIDVIAWSPRTNDLASYLGRAIFLGDEDDAFNPATWFDGEDLRIHASPIEWLQHERQGVVILDERRAGAILRNVRSVICTDTALAERVHECVQRKPNLKIFIDERRAA